ncbi:DNA mismatch repair protein MutS [Sulfobacillus acidophilus TPY]|uniref:DNA mismatch repair protein MutS n=1 Tax=Sulfobacillus acidophilus (strain ATCC 700253 / DSM 10332 / NAL) TaxID=679936 RepID=G8U087_SULAD|nr:DNA mismatch repair protein MutS [Sulfobacillus acidophilus TPY]AEW05336.1 DNA mismatch repair protein MutS [Sulfobacillus acidophilus DSM 10332]
MSHPVKTTPMLDQYYRLKAEQPDALLLFRLGDFYELFGPDAELAAPLLDLQLTSRDGRVPMCGVPHHALHQYARKLLEAGYTVAIAEQMEDPALAKGLVDRQIVRVLTPGTVIPEDDEGVPRLAVWYRDRSGWTLAVAELSTGTVHLVEGGLAEGDLEQLQELWALWHPDEFLSNHPLPFEVTSRAVTADGWFQKVSPLAVEKYLASAFHSVSLKSWGIDDPAHPRLAPVLWALWRYLESLQRRSPRHLTQIVWHALGGSVRIGPTQLAQLDIVDGPYSLYRHLDLTATKMGSRVLREWLERPLADRAAIESRHRRVVWLVQKALVRDQLREALAQVGDLSRRVARTVLGLARPRDLAAIRTALSRIPTIAALLVDAPDASGLDPEDTDWTELATLLDGLIDPPPARWDDSPLVKDGLDPEIDQQRQLLRDQRERLALLEATERERSRIKSLRVGYHRTYGYYLEVTKSQAKEVPGDWQRRQSTTHTERYSSDALRELEHQIQSADGTIRARERDWTEKWLQAITQSADRLTRVSRRLAEWDALNALAEAMVRYHYTSPQWVDDAAPVVIEGLQHPVLAQHLEDYVVSDLTISPPCRAIVITGPNMGGKSTYMRAIAQNVLMAQIGGGVAARRFQMPVRHAVLTRIGADDNLVRGQSTFMVEMEEVAAILRQAGSRALVLLDELGRGTSTYDGMALALAVMERLATADGPITLFATHYHELTDLAEQHPHMTNLTVEVVETARQPIFTHRVIPGRASRSYGIHVAQMAGLPPTVIARAKAYLKELESRHPSAAAPAEQITLFAPDPIWEQFRQSLLALNLDDVSPREAWQWLQQWQARLGGK